MTEREILVKILDDSDPEGGTFPGQDEDLETFWGAQADAILDSDWLRKVKADTLREAAEEARYQLGTEASGHTSTYSVRKWLNERAKQIQG